MGRISEWLAGWTVRDTVLFTGMRRHLPSVVVRGDQMAEEMGGQCLRARYLRDSGVRGNRAVIWIGEADLDRVARFGKFTPQILDRINPIIDPKVDYNKVNRAFDYLFLNTESSVNWLGPAPEGGWKYSVIPHHHCNTRGFILPESRVSHPKVVGYLGERDNLHDIEAIERGIEKLGLKFLIADIDNLDAYEEMDIGIAWTRRETLRDETRSNIKLTNFSAYGIPSVVCDYESYREVDANLGGGSALIRGELSDFIDGIAELANNEDLRREQNSKAQRAQQIYARSSIAKIYWTAIDDAQKVHESLHNKSAA